MSRYDAKIGSTNFCYWYLYPDFSPIVQTNMENVKGEMREYGLLRSDWLDRYVAQTAVKASRSIMAPNGNSRRPALIEYRAMKLLSNAYQRCALPIGHLELPLI